MTLPKEIQEQIIKSEAELSKLRLLVEKSYPHLPKDTWLWLDKAQVQLRGFQKLLKISTQG